MSFPLDFIALILVTLACITPRLAQPLSRGVVLIIGILAVGAYGASIGTFIGFEQTKGKTYVIYGYISY